MYVNIYVHRYIYIEGDCYSSSTHVHMYALMLGTTRVRCGYSTNWRATRPSLPSCLPSGAVYFATQQSGFRYLYLHIYISTYCYV